MTDIEQSLQRAGDETRRLASTRPIVAPPREKRAAPARGWLVFATAFAAVVVLFGVVPWAMQTGGVAPLGDAPTTIGSGEATTSTPVTTAQPAADCSAAGVEVRPAAGDLPDRVAAVRQDIVDAASACDFVALEAMAPPAFRTSFGGGGIENLARWEEEGEGRLDTLLHLLGTTPGVIDLENGETIYVWPGAATYESWDAVPPELVDELEPITSRRDLDDFAAFGSYVGWRTGIDSNGVWLYFIAGD